MNTDLPSEEPKKSPNQILREELHEGMEALSRSSTRLFLSSISAGLDLGFSFFLIAVVRTLAADQVSPPVVELWTALVYPLGFILVVMGRSELFTEQTTLAILPLLSGQATWKMVMRLWGIVYIANLLGAAIFAGIVVLVGPNLHVIDPQVFEEIAEKIVSYDWWVILLSATLAGWLMGLLSWLVVAGRDTISQIVIVFLITATIGLGHLHHSIVGTVEVLAGIFQGDRTTFADFAHFLLWTTLGNAFGGGFFVAVLKFGHARKSRHDGSIDEDGNVALHETDKNDQ